MTAKATKMMQLFILITISFAILAAVTFLHYGQFNHEELGIINLIIGVMLRELQTIIVYYFGDRN